MQSFSPPDEPMQRLETTNKLAGTLVLLHDPSLPSSQPIPPRFGYLSKCNGREHSYSQAMPRNRINRTSYPFSLTLSAVLPVQQRHSSRRSVPRIDKEILHEPQLQCQSDCQSYPLADDGTTLNRYRLQAVSPSGLPTGLAEWEQTLAEHLEPTTPDSRGFDTWFGLTSHNAKSLCTSAVEYTPGFAEPPCIMKMPEESHLENIRPEDFADPMAELNYRVGQDNDHITSITSHRSRHTDTFGVPENTTPRLLDDSVNPDAHLRRDAPRGSRYRHFADCIPKLTPFCESRGGFALTPPLISASVVLHLDRNSISNNPTDSVADNLNVSSDQVNFGGQLMSIGIAVAGIPTNLVLLRLEASVWTIYQSGASPP
ncbi:uncharacterized protein DSM5745_00133 [Aspergillus mulundensis]|uniref:Uncharacterized protein n=1 Tax=Aspergillus mulundensis TaxID=1810919 RepID=A0A3D8T2Z1_9EURO|nr:hypothetical protein DSM5745_00133 [Aspergillus mulundensis]RDW92811.1 hypothetical protein DSM5745_00133 [Aspergillus mulundensis]